MAKQTDRKETGSVSAKRPSGAKPSGAKTTGAKPSGARASGSKPASAKPSGSNPADVRTSGAKPASSPQSTRGGATRRESPDRAAVDAALDKMEFGPEIKTHSSDKIQGRPKGFFTRFAIAAFPQKYDSLGEKIRKIVLIAAIFVFIGALIFLIWQMRSVQRGVDVTSEIAQLVGATDDVSIDYPPFGTNEVWNGPGNESTVVIEDEPIDVTTVPNTILNIDFDKLKDINPDARAWIWITGTQLNNPVVVGEDNEYYISHDFYGEESISGTIMSTHLNRWDGTDDNIILFGHNMQTGDFFGTVRRYVPNDSSAEPVAFYKRHPTVMLSTPDEGPQEYKIFAAVLFNTEEQYGEVFNYITKTRFTSRDDFNNYIIDIMDRSWFFTDVDLQYGDKLLTLSTCWWPMGQSVDTRWVLFARKTRPGEPPVDASLVKRNFYPKYFDYFYTVYGGYWPGSTWDRRKLLGYSE